MLLIYNFLSYWGRRIDFYCLKTISALNIMNSLNLRCSYCWCQVHWHLWNRLFKFSYTLVEMILSFSCCWFCLISFYQSSISKKFGLFILNCLIDHNFLMDCCRLELNLLMWTGCWVSVIDWFYLRQNNYWNCSIAISKNNNPLLIIFASLFVGLSFLKEILLFKLLIIFRIQYSNNYLFFILIFF